MKPNVQRITRTLHKWFGLTLGLQLLLWSASGLYMVAVDLDYIHGDFLVRQPPPIRGDTGKVISLAALTHSRNGVERIRLKALPGSGRLVYEVHQRGGRELVDATTGERLSPLSADAIQALARAYYAGDGEIISVELLSAVPVEVRGRPASMWRATFDDRWKTHFYLDPDTGALLTRRHRWWRVFDAFWMLHVMDYGYERDDVNNTLLRAASGFAAIFGVTGLVLLVFSFGMNGRRRFVA